MRCALPGSCATAQTRRRLKKTRAPRPVLPARGYAASTSMPAQRLSQAAPESVLLPTNASNHQPAPARIHSAAPVLSPGTSNRSPQDPAVWAHPWSLDFEFWVLLLALLRQFSSATLARSRLRTADSRRAIHKESPQGCRYRWLSSPGARYVSRF